MINFIFVRCSLQLFTVVVIFNNPVVVKTNILKMKYLLLTFFLCLSIFPAAQSNTSLPIVPKPAHESTSGQQVSLQKKWSVYIPSQFDIYGEYLSSLFNEFGIEIVNSGKDKAQIVVNVNKKLSENPEAYHLEITGKGKITIGIGA